MKKISFISSIILVLLLVSLTANARTIQGRVLSSNDSTAIVGAKCSLIIDGRVLNSTESGEKGLFSIETEISSSVNLEISFEEYTPTKILIKSGTNNLNIGDIFIDKSTTLDEVTVSANSVIHSQGRTIVYPSGADVRASATSISLFQKLPLDGLEANPITRTLSVYGGKPTILINGVPSTMNDVNSLQPKDIEKIDYSPVTPARYADKGTTGFINIQLKARKDGGQIYAWGRSAVSTIFIDADLKTSYHQGPSQFTVAYNPSWRNYQDVFDNYTNSYIGDDFRVNIEEHDRNPFWYHTHEMKLKYDYSPTAKTLFSATFTATPLNRKSRSIANTVDSWLGDYKNNDISTTKDFAPSLDLFLRRDFNECNSLEAQIVGTLSSSDYRHDNQYVFSDGSEQSYITDADSRRRSLISEISYIHNFSKKTQLSAGFQNTVSHSTNKYLNTDYKPVLTENNNYIYAKIGHQLKKVYLSFSTGAKLYWVNNDVNKRHFIRNLSSVQAQYRIDSKWNLFASFRYSPSIPTLSSLTDYPRQTTPYLISNGNPDLKVADWFFYQLRPSFRHKKFSATLSLQLQDVKNKIISDVIYLGNKLFLSQSINSKSSITYSSNLNVRLNDIYGFGINANVGVKRYECSGIDWKHHLNSFDGNFSIWWNKGPYTISYFRKIPGKYLNGHRVGKDENDDTLQFEWQPDKHWTIGAAWMYMFEKKGTQYPSWNYSSVNPSYRERYIKNNANMVVLSISYTSDFGSIFRTGRRSLNNSDSGSSLLKF